MNSYSNVNIFTSMIYQGSDDEDLAQDASGLHFTGNSKLTQILTLISTSYLNNLSFLFEENFLNSPKPKFVHTEEKLSRFLSRKYPVVERALAQNAKNIFFDYSAALNEK